MKRSERIFLGIEPKKYNVKTEREEWADAGCHNNEEWHLHLKRLFERDLYSDEKDGCYVGVLQKKKDEDDA